MMDRDLTINYSFNDWSYAIVTGYSGEGNTANIAYTALKKSQYEENLLKVEEIKSSAFKNCTQLEYAFLPEGITEINDYAFANCSNLIEINIPASVTYISETAFVGCTNLQHITIDPKNKRYYVNSGCLVSRYQDGSTNVIIFGNKFSEIPTDDAIDTIYDYAFYGSDITTIAIPGNITYIGDYAFSECTSLISIDFTNASALSYISDYSFKNCTSLQNLVFPLNLHSFGKGAFSGCSNLASIYLDKNIDKLNSSWLEDPDDLTFAGCTSLSSITVSPDNPYYKSINNCIIAYSEAQPDSLTIVLGCKTSSIPLTTNLRYLYISYGAFYKCDIASINMSAASSLSIVQISSYAFAECKNLTQVSMPTTTWCVPDTYAFAWCKNLTTITARDISLSKYVFSDCYSLTNIPTLSGITAIPEGAFSDCISLTSISLPDDITWINSGAFNNCESLSSINLPSNLTTLNAHTFNNCISLTNIILPASITTIRQEAFRNCKNLSTINIHDNITTLETGAFCYCTGLTSITLGKNLASIGSDAFLGCAQSLATITVAAENTKYKCIDNCLIDIDNKQIILTCTNSTIPSDSSITSIADSAFSYRTDLIGISIPDNITTIGEFYNCSSLENISIPATVSTFKGCINCTSLNKVEVLNPNLSLSYSSFDNCPALSYIKASVSQIRAIIENCNSTAYTLEFTTADSVQQYFAKNKNIVSLLLHDDTTVIYDYAFMDCSNLQSVKLPKNLNNANFATAFKNCENLMSLSLDSSNTYFYELNNCIFEIATGMLIMGCSGSIIPTDIEITSIGSYAFCSGLPRTSSIFRLSNNIRDISPYAFTTDISNFNIVLEIPDVEISFNYNAFYGCKELSEIRFEGEASGISLGENAFAECSNITYISGPFNKVQHILYYQINATCGVNLTSVEETIPDYAFQNRNITSILIPHTISYIGTSAFSNCKNLSEIIVDCDTVLQNIGNDAFYNCLNLKKVTLLEANINSWFNITFQTMYSNPLYYGAELHDMGGLVTTLIIPDNIGAISQYQFINCKQFTSIENFDHVSYIGKSAFENCMGLTSLAIPANITNIMDDAFSGCGNLDYIYGGNDTYKVINNCVIFSGRYLVLGCNNSIIPAGITVIFLNAFKNCTRLTSITIPKTVYLISTNFIGCTNLVNLTVEAGNSYYYSRNNCIFYYNNVSQTSLSVGCKTSIIPDDITGDFSIEDNAFRGKGLTSISIPSNVRTIGRLAFADNPDLSAVELNEGIRSLGVNLFKNCKSLKELILPSSIVYNTTNSLWGCSKLEKLTILAKLTNDQQANEFFGYFFSSALPSEDASLADDYIEIYQQKYSRSYSRIFYIPKSLREVTMNIGLTDGYFSNCSMLTKINLTSEVDGISDYTFKGCTSLSAVDMINAPLTTIALSFVDCTSLTSVILPDTVTWIAPGAFDNCINLTTISIPKNLGHISSNAFNNCKKLKCVFINSISDWCKISFDNPTANPLYYGANLFIDDKPIREITLLANCSYINQYTFYNCSFRQLNVPKELSAIALGAFTGCYCLNKIFYSASYDKWQNISITRGSESWSNEPVLYPNALYCRQFYNTKYTNNPIQIDSAICDSIGDNLPENYLRQKLYNINNISTEATLADCNTKINELLAILRTANIIRKED